MQSNKEILKKKKIIGPILHNNWFQIQDLTTYQNKFRNNKKNIDNKYRNNANKKSVKFTYIIQKYASKKCLYNQKKFRDNFLEIN